MENNNIICKVVLVGDSGVGKTCIIQRYVTNQYKDDNDSTVTSSYTFKKLDFKKLNKSISMDIWDTAGQEAYRAMSKHFYLNAAIGILVYDICRKESFESIKNYWYEQLKISGEENMIIGIAGNKCDLFTKEQVSEEEGENFAKEIGAIFRLTSSKEHMGIDELFEECGKKYLQNNKLIDITNNKEDKIDLKKGHKNNKKKKSKIC